MPSKPPIFVVLGSINMDLNVVVPRLPAPGETIVGERFYTSPGGKGANQAVAAAKLGASVRMVGRVGKDAFGSEMLASLRFYGIDASGVALDPRNASGIASILLDARGQNYIIAVYGANMACDEQQVEAAKAALDGADALFLQLEVPIDVSLEVARYARSRGVRVVWDPAPARELPPEVFAALDVLTPNQHEAAALTGIKVTDARSAERAADALLRMGVPTAVVKLGEQGVFYANASERGHVPPFEVEVVDTVGAGDAFGAGMVIALCEGKSLSEAVRYGAAAGAMAVTKRGAQEAMPSREEVEALLAQASR
ncbi:MAG: ribokinase [Chloroflexi bacterium]|nr:ribokinase [Chloroflexota bacterium]